MFTELASEMSTYADGVRQVMDRAWENEGYRNWAGRWMQHCGLQPEQIEQRRREFEQFRKDDQAESDAPYEVKAAAGGKRFKR